MDTQLSNSLNQQVTQLANTTGQITSKRIEKETVDAELEALMSKRDLIERNIENIHHINNESDAQKFRQDQEQKKNKDVKDATDFTVDKHSKDSDKFDGTGKSKDADNGKSPDKDNVKPLKDEKTKINA